MCSAGFAKLLDFQTIRIVLFVLYRLVVSIFALRAGERNRHAHRQHLPVPNDDASIRAAQLNLPQRATVCQEKGPADADIFTYFLFP
jgi:hypothetical protein